MITFQLNAAHSSLYMAKNLKCSMDKQLHKIRNTIIRDKIGFEKMVGSHLRFKHVGIKPIEAR